MTSIPLFLTHPHPCSYLVGQRAQSLLVHPDCQLTPPVYSQLLAQGFRRSGDDVYAPHCAECSACVPVRLEVARFKANRRQKRCLKKNSGTQAIVKPAVFEQTHYDMYLRYQDSRHEEGAMAHSSPGDYLDFFGSSWCDTCFVEFRINDEPACVAVVDRFDQAWSAVYTFFEPEFSSYSPGMYAVLWQIEQARRLGREFLYLGYWIKDCKKMAYKDQYQPLQQFIGRRWVEIPPAGIS